MGLLSFYMEDKRILLGVVDECFEVIQRLRIATLLMNMRLAAAQGCLTVQQIWGT